MTTNDAQIESTADANLDRYRVWASTTLTETPVTSVVIPTYNEEWRVVPTIGAVAFAMSQRGEAWELIISDDGSTDDTKKLVEELNLPNLRFLDSANTGKGGAVRRGVQQAKGRYVLFVDADQSTPIEQFESLLTPILDHEAHIAIGSRSASGADVANKSTARKVFSWALNKIVHIGFRLPYQDTQCGFKLFTAEAAQELFAVQQIDGFSFDLELLYLAQRFGYQVAEVPVEWFDAPGSTVDPVKVAMTFGKDLLRIRWWSLRGKYDQRPA